MPDETPKNRSVRVTGGRVPPAERVYAPSGRADDADDFSPYERAVLKRLDRRAASADDLLWYVRGIWWFLYAPVLAALVLGFLALAALAFHG